MQKQKARFVVKGTIAMLRADLAKLEAEQKELSHELNLHGKVVAAKTGHYSTIHNLIKMCKSTIETLTQYAVSQGEEV